MERLDKLLSLHNICSRRQAAALTRAGQVRLNGVAVRRADIHVDTARDTLEVNGKPLLLQQHLYIMMHKPAGVLSASRDPHGKTVVDLLPPELQRRGLFPAGRLDKDTEGLLILTDDGDFAHRMLAPKKHVAKWYEARLDLPVTPQDADAFARGLELEDLHCLPALLQALPPYGDGTPRARVAVREGKFHQVKRMFLSVGKQVLYLKRIKIGLLELDPALCPGECRLLQENELETIFLPDPLAEPRRP
ncbi:pseudouridine synthase [Hydrogeniiclostridium mannosilyticum]|uniref:pseudouridine synthase n=1 Tax=Hydrogeniiclostridium mannosilyticum TaxID=2764322 RepID=UPI0018ABAA3F|nr:pseudouridine synthase [Hydrogeniiclostridium mannosilyticum]